MDLITITLPKHLHVLLLEDSEMRIAWFEKKIENLHVCRTVQEFKDYFATHPCVDFIFFDHDLGPEGGSGVDAAKFMVEKFGTGKKWGLIHSWNTTGAQEMQKILIGTHHIPFGDFDVKEI
jgi:hypothetical protein